MRTSQTIFPVLLAMSAFACGSVTQEAEEDAGMATIDAGDCEPADPAIETCGNGVDEDCNGEIDDPALCDGAALLEIVQNPSGGAWATADVKIEARPVSGATGSLECRSGKVATDNTLTTAFAPCDGTEFTPVVDLSSTGSGLYRTEIRFVHADGTESEAVPLTYYLHEGLQGALACSLAATPEAIFTKALERLPQTLPGSSTTLLFDDSAEAGDDGFGQLANPFIRLNFTPRHSAAFGFGEPPDKANWGPGDGLLRVLSLRRHFQFNADKSLVLMTRRYAARRGLVVNTSCVVLKVGRNLGGGYRKGRDDCDAIVMNREGAGVCMGVSESGVITFAFTPDSDIFSSLAGSTLDIPLTDGVDNAMWRKIGAIYSPTLATTAERASCGVNRDTCAGAGYGGRWGYRNFSPKCYGNPSCTAEFDALPVDSGLTWDALFLPDDGLFRFE